MYVLFFYYKQYVGYAKLANGRYSIFSLFTCPILKQHAVRFDIGRIFVLCVFTQKCFINIFFTRFFTQNVAMFACGKILRNTFSHPGFNAILNLRLTFTLLSAKHTRVIVKVKFVENSVLKSFNI